MKMVRKMNAADRNELALRKLLQLTKSSKVSVVFVRTPVTLEYYYESLEEDSRILDHIFSIADEVLPEGNWRLFDGIGFSDDHCDFGDPNHVNGNLGARFTKDLDTFLRAKEQRVVFKHK
jgi:hypothetical protein